MLQNQDDFEREPNLRINATEHEEERVITASEISTNHDCDILLNNFLIKKRRFRVLLNSDRIIWEALERGVPVSSQTQQNLKKDCTILGAKLSSDPVTNVPSNLLHICDVIAVTKSDCETATKISNCSPTGQFLIIHYAKRIIKSPEDCNRWRVRSISFYNADVYIVQQWYDNINQRLAFQWRIRRLVVFINPFGGRRQGLQIYERHCKPLFRLAGIDASCLISQRPNQIRDILMSHDLSPYDAVCCVGGDGTVAEVINGLLFRGIRDKGMDMRRPEFLPKPKLPMGIIPAGSTDTVAYSLHGTADVETATIHLILGQRRGLDICSVNNNEGILRFCASVLSYGYLGDVAAESEKYRWMGTKRYEYTGIKAFLKNRGYEAEIRLLLPNVADEQQQPPNNDIDVATANQSECCYFNCQHCAKVIVNEGNIKPNHEKRANNDYDRDERPTSSTSDRLNSNNEIATDQVDALYNKLYIENDNVRMDDYDYPDRNVNDNCDETCVIDEQKFSVIEKIITNEQQHDLNYRVESNIKSCDGGIAMGGASLKDAQNNDNEDNKVSSDINNESSKPNFQWKTIRGSFFMISGANITCACSRSPNGISRYNHLGNGHLDLILVRKTSLWNNVRFVINSMGRNGDIRNLPFVEVYRTRKFCFKIPRLMQEAYNFSGSSQPITATGYDTTANENDKASRWNCDGEVVNDWDVVMSSHCQLIDVLMRGPYPYVKRSVGDRASIFCCCGDVSN